MATYTTRTTHRSDYKPQVGDIVKFHMFGCRDKIGVVLKVEQIKIDYGTCKVVEDGCWVSYENKEPTWDPVYSLEKINGNH